MTTLPKRGWSPALRSFWPLAAAVLIAGGTSGCALTSKADLVGIRYFSPESTRPHLTAGDASEPHVGPSLEVRLGRVTSGAHLRERIAYRGGAYEMGYYEDQRWTERPEIYVRRELARTLFEERGFRHVLGGAAPTLDVEVVAFDELRLPAGRAARVQLKVVLSEDRGVIFEQTLTIDRPVATAGKPKIEDVVAAMAEALDVAADQVATRVAAEIAARPPRR